MLLTRHRLQRLDRLRIDVQVMARPDEARSAPCLVRLAHRAAGDAVVSLVELPLISDSLGAEIRELE